MNWIHPLSAELDEDPAVLGAKGHGLVVLHRLGLPVPPGFVVGTGACRAQLRGGRMPDDLPAQLAAAVAGVEEVTGRRLGAPRRPLTVAVRSGASVSMPGMMNTLLNVGLTDGAVAALAAETGDRRFALDSRLRFLSHFAVAVGGVPPESVAAVVSATATDRRDATHLAAAIRRVEAVVRARTGAPVPDDASRQVALAVEAVLSSWDTPRARTYRHLHGIAADLGTAVIVQRMVFGNRGARSGAGVAFSRSPTTGDPAPFGEVLFGCQGDDVVSGTSPTRPLAEVAEREPRVWAELCEAMARIEEHYRDACHVEFTVEDGRLWILQVRPGGLVGRAAVRVAVDLVDEGLISRREALRRVPPAQLAQAGAVRIAHTGATPVLTRGTGACPGVAVGAVAVTADQAVRMAAAGPVILVRPHTSPLDMHGLAAAAGVLTARGGPTSHAAVVARALGRPAVVGAMDVDVDVSAGCVRAGGRTVPQGGIIAVDGTSGEVVVGRPRIVSSDHDAHLHRLLGWADERQAGEPG